MLNTEQFTATNKANFEAVMGLTAKAFEGVEQLTALNLQVVKAGLGEVAETGLAALSAKDPQALLALQAAPLQTAAEKATAYGKQVYGIVAGIKADVEKVAAEQAAAAQSSFVTLIETAGKNAPEGSGNGIALFKSTLATMNNAFDGLQKAGRQAAETAEANYAAVTGSVVKAAGKTKRG
ncbi:TIGR01841 family phasin [Methylibium sp.]|uniref:TIGR01841 family phasin n=1 Tax=Methylibium sp. TaxID=2067992 RepID=UPI003D0B1BCC